MITTCWLRNATKPSAHCAWPHANAKLQRPGAAQRGCIITLGLTATERKRSVIEGCKLRLHLGDRGLAADFAHGLQCCGRPNTNLGNARCRDRGGNLGAS